MVFDKQTAPKELINSPYYHSHSHSSDAFPTYPSFSLFPSLTCFCLTLPFRRPSHLPVCFAPLHRLKTQTCCEISHPSLQFRPSFNFSLSSQIPLVRPVPLIQRDKCLFFRRNKMCRRWSYQREFWARTTAGIISTSAVALFIKPTSTEEKSSKQNALFIASEFAHVFSRRFSAVHKFLICTWCQECQKISKPIIKEEIKPILSPAAGSTLHKKSCW